MLFQQSQFIRGLVTAHTGPADLVPTVLHSGVLQLSLET